MHQGFWQQRWDEGRIGFHRSEVNPNLLAMKGHLPPPGARVFVPLCGKTVDMAYLADAGYHVVGVELVRQAVEAFFTARGQSPTVSQVGAFSRHVAGDVELLCGDALTLDADTLGEVDAVWDRAALIALPPDLRTRYVEHMTALLRPGTRYLLVTLDIPDREGGPPFSIGREEVRARYGPGFELEEVTGAKVSDPDDPFVGAEELRFVMRRRA